MRIKSHESPRALGIRNKKGSGGSARSKQLKKKFKKLSAKLNSQF